MMHRDPIILNRNGRVLVHARDEAHRFVNKYHRKEERGKKTLLDPLEEIEGLGAKKNTIFIASIWRKKRNRLCKY